MSTDTLTTENGSQPIFSEKTCKALAIIAMVGYLISEISTVVYFKGGVHHKDQDLIEALASIEWIGTLVYSIILAIFFYGLKQTLKNCNIISPGSGLMTTLFIISVALIPFSTLLSWISADESADEILVGLIGIFAIPLLIAFIVLELIVALRLLQIEKFKNFSIWLLASLGADIIYEIATSVSDPNQFVGIVALIYVLVFCKFIESFGKVISSK